MSVGGFSNVAPLLGEGDRIQMEELEVQSLPKDRCVLVLPMLDGLVTALLAFWTDDCSHPVGLMPSVVPRKAASCKVDCRLFLWHLAFCFVHHLPIYISRGWRFNDDGCCFMFLGYVFILQQMMGFWLGCDNLLTLLGWPLGITRIIRK